MLPTSKLSARNLQIVRNVLASFTLKGLSLAVGLVTLPAYMRFFDDQQLLGVWFTMIATLTWILNFDLGLGNGLRNRLVEALSEGSHEKIVRYISSTYVGSAILVAVMGLAAWAIVPNTNWNAIFNISTSSIDKKTLTAAVSLVVAGILIQMFLRTISFILYALQKAAAPPLLSLTTSIILLVIALTAPSGTPASNLVLLSSTYAIATNLPLLAATFVVFTTELRKHTPAIRHFESRYARDVMTLGGLFFVLQLMFMIVANTNSILISWLADPSSVVVFQIYSKPFAVGSSIIALGMAPIWSAVTKAHAEGDTEWVVRLYSRLMRMAALVTLVLFVLAPLLGNFVDIWLGDSTIPIDLVYALVFAASASAFSWNYVLSTFASGTGQLRPQVVAMSVGVLLKLTVAVILTSATGNWIWVVVSDIFALLPYIALQPILIRKYKLSSSRVLPANGQST